MRQISRDPFARETLHSEVYIRIKRALFAAAQNQERVVKNTYIDIRLKRMEAKQVQTKNYFAT